MMTEIKQNLVNSQVTCDYIRNVVLGFVLLLIYEEVAPLKNIKHFIYTAN